MNLYCQGMHRQLQLLESLYQENDQALICNECLQSIDDNACKCDDPMPWPIQLVILRLQAEYGIEI